MSDAITTVDDIKKLEKAMVQMPQAECPVMHTFHEGTYLRQVTIPTGATAVGHYQRFEHLNIFVKGKVTVLNDDGSLTTLTAPMTFIGKPGRKCGYVHEEVVWINVYKTDITDVELAEDYLLDKSQSEPIPHMLLDRSADKLDFTKMLEDVGIDESTAKSQAEDTTDMIDFPSGSYSCVVSGSQINGKGLFATRQFEPGEVIAPARIGTKRTPAGRYINHSPTPNAEMVEENGDIYVVALHSIKGCQASLLGEEITTDYRKNVELVRRLACRQ